MTDGDIPLPAKPSGEFVSYCDSYSDGAWRGFDADDMESYARAAVLADREGMYEWLAKGERIFRDAGFSFRFGVWWGSRPWRKA
jgi:hypothetical protein